MPWQQQLVHHVQGEQRRHSIVGKSFPRFGEGEVEKAPGMAHEGRITGARDRSFEFFIRSCPGSFPQIHPRQHFLESRLVAEQIPKRVSFNRCK